MNRSANTSAHDVVNHTHELDELSAQALAYAEQEFGIGHPIWRSIHDQVACFCKCAEECDAEKSQAPANRTARKLTH